MRKQQKQYLFLLPLVLIIGLLFWFFLKELSLYFQYSKTTQEKTDSSIVSPPSDQSDTEPPNQQDVQASEKTVKPFLTSFINFDANTPEKYLKDGKQWMTHALYQELSNPQGGIRGTTEVKKKLLISIERKEPEIEEAGITWTCLVIEEITDHRNQTYREESVYILHMLQEGQRWKVWEVESSGVMD